MKRCCFFVLCLGLGLLLGCGGGSSPTSPTILNVSGTWDADIAPNAGPAFTAVFTLSQSGTQVTGTFTTSQSLGGTASGTVAGATFTFALKENAPCSGSYSGTGTISGGATKLSGSFSGSNSCSNATSNTFTATKR